MDFPLKNVLCNEIRGGSQLTTERIRSSVKLMLITRGLTPGGRLMLFDEWRIFK